VLGADLVYSTKSLVGVSKNDPGGAAVVSRAWHKHRHWPNGLMLNTLAPGNLSATGSLPYCPVAAYS